MVPLVALWLPIVLSAVIVFVASSIIHMVLPYHKNEYRQLPDEDKTLAALRATPLQRGLYVFPFCTHQEMKSPALIEKYKQGPVGFLNILPSGPPAMPKFLIQWFAFCLVIGFFVAYLAGHTVAPGAHYLSFIAWSAPQPSSPTVWEISATASGKDRDGRLPLRKSSTDWYTVY